MERVEADLQHISDAAKTGNARQARAATEAFVKDSADISTTRRKLEREASVD
jgi:hypothetical protein